MDRGDPDVTVFTSAAILPLLPDMLYSSLLRQGKFSWETTQLGFQDWATQVSEEENPSFKLVPCPHVKKGTLSHVVMCTAPFHS